MNNNEIPEYLYPKYDFIFKRLFGYKGNEEITKDLISNIIGEKIKSLKFENPYLIREAKNDKEEVLDIKAMLNNNIQCDIEIQVKNRHDDIYRILDYWSKMYRQGIEKGTNYKQMRRTIVIYISDYDIDELKKYKDYITKWKIKEKSKNYELTNIFEIDIIELSKAKIQLKNDKLKEYRDLKNWIKFLINPKKLREESKMENLSEEVKKAYEIWQSLNLNEEERDIAERRYKELASIEYAKEYEYNLGKAEGQKLRKRRRRKNPE